MSNNIDNTTHILCNSNKNNCNKNNGDNNNIITNTTTTITTLMMTIMLRRIKEENKGIKNFQMLVLMHYHY